MSVFQISEVSLVKNLTRSATTAHDATNYNGLTTWPEKLSGTLYVYRTLNGLAQIVAMSLLVNHTLVYFACCDVVISMKSNIQEPFVVAKV